MDTVDFKLKLNDDDDKKPIDEKEKSEKSNELNYKGGELVCHGAVLLCDWKLLRSSQILSRISYRQRFSYQ